MRPPCAGPATGRSATRSASLRSEAQPATLLAAVQAAGARRVGEQIAAQARPVRERDGVITVECRAATWAQELDLLQDELIATAQRALGEARVRVCDWSSATAPPTIHI